MCRFPVRHQLVNVVCFYTTLVTSQLPLCHFIVAEMAHIPILTVGGRGKKICARSVAPMLGQNVLPHFLATSERFVTVITLLTGSGLAHSGGWCQVLLLEMVG